jgi:hypothetical protein
MIFMASVVSPGGIREVDTIAAAMSTVDGPDPVDSSD